MSVDDLARAVVIDLLVVAIWTLAVGATAPRWPARWLQADRGPLTLRGFESPAFYRRLRVRSWASRLPEAGSAFGGRSKRTLPGREVADLAGYLVEVRRGEWVHWLSTLCIVAIVLVGPWWVAVAFSVIVISVNAVFIVILRHNRVRLLALLGRSERVA